MDKANAADRHIGMRIRQRRLMRGLTQQELAELIDVTYQVVLRYESGKHSVSSGRLYVIAQALSTPIEYFFKGRKQAKAQPHPRLRMLFDVMRNSSEVQDQEYLEVIRELTGALARRARSSRVGQKDGQTQPSGQTPTQSRLAEGRRTVATVRGQNLSAS
jgi:transcriptional regulator with XRE-family HTH domain